MELLHVVGGGEGGGNGGEGKGRDREECVVYNGCLPIRPLGNFPIRISVSCLLLLPPLLLLLLILYGREEGEGVTELWHIINRAEIREVIVDVACTRLAFNTRNKTWQQGNKATHHGARQTSITASNRQPQLGSGAAAQSQATVMTFNGLLINIR